MRSTGPLDRGHGSTRQVDDTVDRRDGRVYNSAPLRCCAVSRGPTTRLELFPVELVVDSNVTMEPLDTVAGLMSEWRAGCADAAGRLVDALYPELRRLAAAKMARERPEHTWQPTALVHEVYMGLTRIKSLPAQEPHPGFNEKAAFLSLAGKMMERRLIDHARPLYRRVPKVALDAAECVEDGATGEASLRHVEELLGETVGHRSEVSHGRRVASLHGRVASLHGHDAWRDRSPIELRTWTTNGGEPRGDDASLRLVRPRLHDRDR